MLKTAKKVSSAPRAKDRPSSRVCSPVHTTPIEYFAEENFVDDARADRWLAEPVRPTRRSSPKQTSQADANEGWAVWPKWNCTEEMHYFRQFNYLKYRAARLQADVRSCRGSVAMLADLNGWLDAAERARNRLVEANLRLVMSLSNKFSSGSTAARDDLFSVGCEALLCAVEKFDYRRGFRFSTYAYAAIQRSIFGFLRREHRWQQRFVADSHDITESATKDAATADRQRIEAVEAQQQIRNLLQALEPREREILMLRFGFGTESEPVSFHAIGQEIGLSKQRVASLYGEIMCKLRKLIATQT